MDEAQQAPSFNADGEGAIFAEAFDYSRPEIKGVLDDWSAGEPEGE